MAIVSISMDDKSLKDIDDLEKSEGFSGRSEVIRAGLRLLVADAEEKNQIRGKVKAVMIMAHDKRVESRITEIKHGFEGIIKTHLHNCLNDNKCLEIFMLEGDAEQVKKFFKLINSSKGTRYAKLLVP